MISECMFKILEENKQERKYYLGVKIPWNNVLSMNH